MDFRRPRRHASLFTNGGALAERPVDSGNNAGSFFYSIEPE